MEIYSPLFVRLTDPTKHIRAKPCKYRIMVIRRFGLRTLSFLEENNRFDHIHLYGTIRFPAKNHMVSSTSSIITIKETSTV